MVDFDFAGRASMYGFTFSEDFEGSMERYLMHGLMPGGFGESMLACDLERALYAADTYNRKVFWGVAMWIREKCPEGSWGSYEAIDNWCKDVNGVRTKWVAWRMLEDVSE